jgi:hypothetical protein
MGEASDLLIRSVLHDLANILAGVRGIVDLNVPGQPLTARDRERLEAVLDEGMTTVDRSRKLAMGLLDDASLEPGPQWRSRLLEELHPMGVLYRCRFELSSEGETQADLWPGEMLAGYVRAITRQVLPHVRDGLLRIHFAADDGCWQVRWSSAARIPPIHPPSDLSVQDIGSRWASLAGHALGATLELEGGALLARVPRR